MKKQSRSMKTHDRQSNKFKQLPNKIQRKEMLQIGALTA